MTKCSRKQRPVAWADDRVYFMPGGQEPKVLWLPK